MGEEERSIGMVFPKWLGHSNKVISCIDIHPLGEYFATGGWDYYVKIWSLQAIRDKEKNVSHKLIALLSDHSKPVNIVRFSPDGKYLASGSDDGMVFIWNKVRCFGRPSTFGIPEDAIQPNPPIQRWVSKTLAGHGDDVNGLAWYQDSQKIASCSIGGTIIIWDVKSATQLHTIKTSIGALSIAVDPLGKYIATQLLDGRLEVHDPSNSFRKVFGQAFVGSEQAIVSRICWTPDGSFLGSTSGWAEGFVSPFFQRDSFVFKYLLEGHVSPTSCVAIPNFLYKDEKGNLCSVVAVGDRSGVISVWIIGAEVKPLVVLDGVSVSTINDMRWTPDGTMLLVALESNPVSRTGSVIAFDFSKAFGNVTPVDEIEMDEIRSRILGENSLRARAASSANAANLLKSLDNEEKEVDLEILQLSTQEVLDRQVETVVDGEIHIQPVLLTAVEKQLVTFTSHVQSNYTHQPAYEYKPPTLGWKRPTAFSGKVTHSVFSEDLIVVAADCYICKLSKETGRRLSTLFYIGGPCRHLSICDGKIFTVGSHCYLIDLDTMEEIEHFECPEYFTDFEFAPPLAVTAHMSGRAWVYDTDLRSWIGGAPAFDDTNIDIEEIERMARLSPSEAAAVQWSDVAVGAVFNAYIGQNDRVAALFGLLEDHADNEASKSYISAFRETMGKHWPESGIKPTE